MSLLPLTVAYAMSLILPCFSNRLSAPIPKELKETFPIGQSEIPEWDETMVRQGCQGIRILATSHPDSHFVVSCSPAWKKIVLEVAGEGDIEVRNDQV